MKPTVILARHGETTWNAKSKLQGHSDQPLSAQGQVQAQALAVWLTTHKVTSILTSTLRRAVETADIVRAHLHLPYIALDTLRERNVGRFEGLTSAELLAIRRQSGLRTDDLYQDWHGVEGVEQDADVATRVHTVIDEFLQRASPDDSALLITHAGVIKSYLHTSFAIPVTRPRCFKVYAGSAMTLMFYAGRPQILGLWQNPDALHKAPRCN